MGLQMPVAESVMTDSHSEAFGASDPEPMKQGGAH